MFGNSYGLEIKEGLLSMSDRLEQQEYFMEVAKIVAKRSTCNRLKVGCVIVKDKRIIATGYCGSLPGTLHCLDIGCKMHEGHCIRTVHAEINAIAQCATFNVSAKGSEVYCTHQPCFECTKALLAAGVKNIFYEIPYDDNPFREELVEESDAVMIKLGED